MYNTRLSNRKPVGKIEVPAKTTNILALVIIMENIKTIASFLKDLDNS